MNFTCPRCGIDVQEGFYGPCTACRGALRNMLIVRVKEMKDGKPTGDAFAYRVDGDGPATHWPCGGEISALGDVIDIAMCDRCSSQGALSTVSEVTAVPYEPKMNVIPNQVATKE